MPPIDLNVALWSRATDKRQFDINEKRLEDLREALGACQSFFARVGKGQNVRGLFVAPEYFFAATNAGLADRSFHLRGVIETEKDYIVQQLLAISKKPEFRGVLIIPGTIAWWKSLDRTPDQNFKRDPATNERTRQLKADISADGRKRSVSNAIDKARRAGAGTGCRIATETLRQRVRESKLPRTTPYPADKKPPNPMANLQDVDWDVAVEVDRVLQDDTQLALYGPINLLARGNPSTLDSYNLLQAGTAERVLKNTAFVFLDGKIVFKYNKMNDFHEALSGDGKLIFCPGSKPGFTTINGIDVGLEICLDHAVGALQKSLTLANAPSVHLHIVTSASVEWFPAMIKDNGYYIHASSERGNTAVAQWKVDASGSRWVTPSQPRELGTKDLPFHFVKEVPVSGDPLKIYKIQLTVP
jgi:hypothetical protein